MACVSSLYGILKFHVEKQTFFKLSHKTCCERMEVELPIEQLLLLSIIQGLTEFWPVSSSGHLNLVHLLTNWQDQGPLIDVAVHFGSLFAVLIYFWRDIVMLLKAAGDLVLGRFNRETQLLIYLIVASVPLLIAGFLLLKSGYYKDLRTIEVIAWANIIFAFVLWWCDQNPPMTRKLEDITWKDALFVGFSQIIALIPGASRSGITMSAARYLEFNRIEAARFAMLLAIPSILGLGLGTVYELVQSGDASLQSDAIFVGVLSFFTALFSIWFMMALLKRMSMMPFVIYRLILGAALLAFIYVI